MKKIFSKEELQEKILLAVNMMGDAISSTLGPTGNNVLIDTSNQSPFITNDGVTIASSIESEDEEVNAILEIVKEASLKTNELVGDGTSTTIVLLQSIINKGMDEICKGKNPILLKNELADSLKDILLKIEEKKIMPTKKDYFSIAYTSSNSKEIGQILGELFFKMQGKFAIHLEESPNEKTYSILKKGYSLEINSLSSLYFQKEKEILLDDVFVFIGKGYLQSLEQVSELINECLRLERPLCLLVEEVSSEVQQELLSLYLSEKKNIFVLSLMEFASHREKIEADLSILSGATIKNLDYDNISFSDVGQVQKLVIEKEEMTMFSDQNISSLIKNLKEKLQDNLDSYEREFIEERLAKLENGVATLYIGAPTKTELKELKMRYEDALWALEVAKGGVLPGEGIVLLEISENLKGTTEGEKILKEALATPFQKIIENTGRNSEEIRQEIQKANYQKIYNFDKDLLEDIKDTVILDPIEVVIVALKNAVSIASLLLTTNYLVVNEESSFKNEVL